MADMTHEPQTEPELSDAELQEMLDALGETDVTVEQLRAKMQEMGDEPEAEPAGATDEAEMPELGEDYTDQDIQAVLDKLGETEVTVEQVRAMLDSLRAGTDEDTSDVSDAEVEAEQARLDAEDRYEDMPTGEKATAASASPIEGTDTSDVTQDEVDAEQARLDAQPGPGASTGEDYDGAPEQSSDDSSGEGGVPEGGQDVQPPEGNATGDAGDNAGDGSQPQSDVNQDTGDGGPSARAIAEGEDAQDADDAATSTGEEANATGNAEDAGAEPTEDRLADQAPEEVDPNSAMTQEIMEFFRDHDEPTDEDIKALASHYDVKPAEMQEMIYAVLSKLVSEGEDVPQSGNIVPSEDALQEQAQKANAEDGLNEATEAAEDTALNQQATAIPQPAMPTDMKDTMVAQPDQSQMQPQMQGMPQQMPSPMQQPMPPQQDQAQAPVMPGQTPQLMQDYYDPMIQKPGFTGSGYVDPTRQSTDMGQGPESMGSEHRERGATTNDSSDSDNQGLIIPGPTTKLGAKAGDVQQLGGSPGGKSAKAQLLEASLQEAGYTQPIRMMFSKAADNILKAAGLELKEVQMTMPSGQLVRTHRWMRPEDSGGSTLHSVGRPCDPVVARKIETDLKAALAEAGLSKPVMISVRDTEDSAIKHAFLSLVNDGSRPHVVLKVKMDTRSGSKIGQGLAKEMIARLEEAQSALKPPRSVDSGSPTGSSSEMTMSKHAWERASERIGYAPIASEVRQLESRRLPDADWYHPTQHDGIICGQDSVIKTILKRSMIPHGIKVP